MEGMIPPGDLRCEVGATIRNLDVRPHFTGLFSEILEIPSSG